MAPVPAQTCLVTRPRLTTRSRFVGAALLSGLLHAASAAGAGQAEDSTAVTQVMVIAALHHDHLVYPHYGPHHVRALLRKFQPDAVGVENPRDWHAQQRLYYPFAVEQYVAMDWARDNGIPAYGIDWAARQSEPDSSRLSELSQKLLARDPETRHQVARGLDSHTRQMASIVYSDIRQDVLYMHTSDIVQYLKRLERRPAEAAMLETRDSHILENVLAVARLGHVRRLAVVIGGAHLPGLRKRLSGEPDVEWVDAVELLPLSDLDVEATLADVYWLLSRHLDGINMEWNPQWHDWRRTHELLQAALSEAPDSAVTRYFQARWDWWMGNDSKAEAELQELAQLDPDVAFPFPINSIWLWPPLSSVRAKAMFSLANLHDYRGDREKALALYGQMLELGESLNVYGHQILFLSYDVREYIEGFLDEPYCRCAEEVYRPKRYFYERTPEDLRTVPWVW